MFEKFTERGRQAMVFARREAQRLKHEIIGTEHILLGILEEGEGVAIKAFRKLDVDPHTVRAEVAKRIKPSASAPDALGQLPFAPRTKRAIELAGEAANAMGHQVIGTEHLLLGLLREGEGIAAQVLQGLGIEQDRLLETILEALGADPLPPPERPRSEERDLRREALAQRSLTDRPSVMEPVGALLRQGRSIALVGPKRVGKTSIVLAMSRAKAEGLSYRSVDYRVFDEFHAWGSSTVRRPGSVCVIAQAELLTASRSVNANLLEDRMQGGERLILEFRDGDLEKFAARYPLIAKNIVTVEVKPPAPDECRQLLDAARTRLKETAKLEIADDVLGEADRLARDRWRHLVPPWPTIMTLWAAESIHRETSARGDEQQLLKDIDQLEKSGEPSKLQEAEVLKRHLEGLRSITGTGLSIESVRRAIGELSGSSQL